MAKLRNPTTGAIHEVADADVGAALQEGYTTDISEKSAQAADRALLSAEIHKEKGALADVQAFSQGAGRSALDMALTPARLLGGDGGPTSADLLAEAGLGSVEEQQALAQTDEATVALGGIMPDLALTLATAGAGSALTGSKLGATALNLAGDAVLGGLAGAQVAEESAWRETGQRATTEDLATSVGLGALGGGALGALGGAASKGIGKAGKALKEGAGDLADGGLTRLADKIPGGSKFKQVAGMADGKADDILTGRARKGLETATAKESKALKSLRKEQQAAAKAKVDYDAGRQKLVRDMGEAVKSAEAKSAKALKKLEADRAKILTKKVKNTGEIKQIKKSIKELEDNPALSSRIKDLAEEEKRLARNEKYYSEAVESRGEDAAKGQLKGLESSRDRVATKRAEVAKLKEEQAAKIKGKKAEIDELSKAEVNRALKEVDAKIADATADGRSAKRTVQRKFANKAKDQKDKYVSGSRSRTEKISDLEDSATTASLKRGMAEKEVARAAEASAAVRDAGGALKSIMGKGEGIPEQLIDGVTRAAQAYVQPGGRIQAHLAALMTKKPYGDWKPQRSFDAALDTVLAGSDYEPAELTQTVLGEYSSSFAEPKVAYVANMELIRKIAQDPTLMMEAVNEAVDPMLQQVQPELYQQMTQSAMKAIEVIGRYSKPIKADPLTGQQRHYVSTSESLAYKDAWETAFSPQKFVNDFASGRLTKEKWGIAQEVYPALTQEFQFQTMALLQEEQPAMSPTQRYQLSIVTGSRDTMSTGIYQQTYQEAAESAMPQNPPTPRPQASTTAKIEKTGTLSEQAMTGA